MEKLQPVIKQIFWILFGFAVILILIGWWSASADLSTQIEDRRNKVDQAFTEADKPVQQVPNARWTAGAKEENEEHEQALLRASERLRQDQLEARVYPESIRDELNQIRFRKPIDSTALRERFGELYRSYFRKQLEVLDPFERGEGLVVVNESQITQKDERKWVRNPPTSKEIWDALEDIWLLRSIYDSIAMVNRGAERIDKAPLRALMMLKLRGGDPEAEPGGGGGAANPFGGGEGGMGGMEGGMGGFGGGAGYGGAAGPGATAGSGPWKSFVGSLSSDLLTEEFGAVSGGSGAMSSGGYGEQMGGTEFGSESFGGPSTAAAVEEDRYVHDEEYEEDIPYRTRAFLLQVKILQQDIPKLLAELTNSKFPVEIVRVDVEFGNQQGGGGASGGYGGEMSGYGGAEGGGTGGYGGEMGGYGGTEAAGYSGGGFGSEGLGGGGFGAAATPGLGNPGLGAGPAGGGPGMPGSAGRNSKPLTPAEQRKVAQGERLLKMAMVDPDLSTVRVAGLMTMYRSPEENEAEAEAEAEEQTEAGAQTNNTPPTGEGVDPAAADSDPATGTADGETPGADTSETDPAQTNPSTTDSGDAGADSATGEPAAGNSDATPPDTPASGDAASADPATTGNADPDSAGTPEGSPAPAGSQ